MTGLLLRPAPELEIREFTPEDEPGVSDVFAAAEDYVVAATGNHALPGDVQSLFYAVPEGMEPDAKDLLVITSKQVVVGLVDVVPGYPRADAAALGIFLLHPDHRRQGIGTTVAAALLSLARERGIHLVTATTPLGWAPGAAFLARIGFTVEPAGQAGHNAGNRNLPPSESRVLRAQFRL